MADALAHLRVAERRHSEASPRSGTTSRLTFSCYIASASIPRSASDFYPGDSSYPENDDAAAYKDGR